MLRYLLAVAVGLYLVTVSPAWVRTDLSATPTIGLPGYYTWVVTASTDDGGQIVGFDFASRPSYGFFGTFNQVNPGGLPTIFQDANSSFAAIGADVSQDSQFLFYSSHSNIVVPDGFASESSSSLRAVFASPSSLGTTDVPIAQLVVPNYETTWIEGTVTVSYWGSFEEIPVRTIWPIPEPATGSLVGMACIGLFGMRRRSK